MSHKSSNEKPRIAVLGLGHVGLPTALGFAELGWEVIGADDDASKVAMIRSGKRHSTSLVLTICLPAGWPAVG